ncbi:MAG: hypothetical protein WC998_00695 [Candidatus Paceibacterota bacterium]|jgi:hypothetical protein
MELHEVRIGMVVESDNSFFRKIKKERGKVVGIENGFVQVQVILKNTRKGKDFAIVYLLPSDIEEVKVVVDTGLSKFPEDYSGDNKLQGEE